MQVRALVVYDEAKKEAALEEETLIHASEEVFLAQLSRSFVCVCVCVCVCYEAYRYLHLPPPSYKEREKPLTRKPCKAHRTAPSRAPQAPRT